ncbi:MAG: carbohydrate porin [Gomphosphaeria aponina SAG 52.96 = DSM 107014]|uniref:Carbohydrate porin n=1 Tax=Gomphosphaeria aponina SAG 52.96 = DSM 107014 TaxID=1521640 RepID=A0A941GRR0_9CHRO|nr:carbohydrate porin [Gomphosphaeria aponina SAG 52.96 = DSM 107014]
MWKFCKFLAVTPALVGALFIAQSANASEIEKGASQRRNESATLEQIQNYSAEENSAEQVTSVSQFRDVQPTDWAFEALRSLVERYGCIEGYPNQTYLGSQPLSRYEFAAGLNSCLNQMERLIAESQAIIREDMEKLQRLTLEFAAEYAAIGARVDNLEGRVAPLEDHQFSTTTKLQGEIVFGLYGVAAGEKDGGESIDLIPAFGQRTRLRFSTSFTGEDLLFFRLATGNIPEFSDYTGTFQGNLAFSQPDDNDLALEVLLYELPLGENARLWIEPVGGAADDFTNTMNFLDGDGDAGALSAFGTRNPIYYPMKNTGVGFQGQWGAFEVSAGYLASEGSDPAQGAGLFNGPYSALGQIGYQRGDRFGVAFTYIHGYNNLDTGTGSNLANFSTFTEDFFGEAVPTSSNSYGLQLSWHIANNLVLGGWGGYTKATTLNTLGGQINRGSLDIWNWAITLAFPDFIKEGGRAGLIVGMQPWVTESSIKLPGGVTNTDDDTSMHFEAFYEYPLTDNIRITPGIIVVTSPDNNSDNSALVIGTIRTNFSF